jgi:hypothetical protein
MHKDDVEQLLSNERLIAQVLEIRKPPEAASRGKNWKELLFETAGGVALITVVLGGIVGGVITSSFQSHETENETQHLDQQARIDRERAANERLEQLRLDSAKTLFELTFNGISAAEDLLQLSTKAFSDPSLIKQRDEVRRRYNEADGTWRKSHGVDGLLFVYYHNSIVGVADEWTKTDQAVTAYMNCASDWTIAHPFYSENLPKGCSDERRVVDESFAALRQGLVLVGH